MHAHSEVLRVGKIGARYRARAVFGPYFTVFTVFARLSAPYVRRECALLRRDCALPRLTCAIRRRRRAFLFPLREKVARRAG